MPANVAFQRDEATLIARALDANEQGVWLVHGLQGSSGETCYGPVPGWIYQLILHCTHGLSGVVLARAALSSLVLTASLYSLCRTLQLSRWFLPLVLLCPYLFFSHRTPWDNSFCLPAATALLACYASFLQRASAGRLLGTLGCALLLLMIHPMSLPLVIAVALHALCRRGRDVLRLAWCPAIAMGIACLLFFPYIHSQAHASGRPIHLDVAAASFPLSSGQLLGATAFYFDALKPWDAALGHLFQIIAFPTLWSYLLVWIGAACLLWRWLARRPLAGSLQQDILPICLFTLLAQGLIHAAYGLPALPHYHNGAWIAGVMLAWFAADQLVVARPAARWLLAAHTLICAAVTGAIMYRMASAQGTASLPQGPLLRDQVQLVHDLAALPRNSLVAYSNTPARKRSDAEVYTVRTARMCLIARLEGLALPQLTPRPEHATHVLQTATMPDGSTRVTVVAMQRPR
jgi:hypothetical protein